MSKRGIFVGLRPQEDFSAALLEATDGTEPLDEQHITLAYLGKWQPEVDIESLLNCVRDWAMRTPPIFGRTLGYGVFKNETESVLHARWHLGESGTWREDLVQSLASYGFEPGHDFEFTPHQTLAYAPAGSEFTSHEDIVWYVGQRFDEVWLVVNGQWDVFKLEGALPA
jgi:2'-5' RNA ligase